MIELKEKPKIITISNLNQFFDFKSVSSGGIKPGMFVQFRYSSPDGVHDVKPLVFVLEKRGDRIWGLNFHYQFGLIAPIVEMKDNQVKKYLLESSEYKKHQQELSKPQKEEMKVAGTPDVKELQQNINKEKEEKKNPEFDLRKVRIPPDILELFTNDKINVSNKFLRNYLFNRMSGLQKLSYKIL